MKNQKGITLIALVITIIVLLILAAVSISAIVGEDGITNRAQNAKDKTAIATEKEQINLSYSACKVGNANTKEEGLKAPVEVSELQAEMDKSYGTGMVSVSGNSSGLLVKYLDSKRTYMIMQNGKVISDVSKVFNGSSTGPIGIAEDGSVVDMSNWLYEYFDEDFFGIENGGYTLSTGGTNFSKGYVGEIVNGRIVGEIPAYIYTDPTGESENPEDFVLLPVVGLYNTFEGIEELEYPPEIPSTVHDLRYTFAGCINLKEAPKIPDHIDTLYGTFSGCINMRIPEIPENIKDMRYTFRGCTQIVNAPKLPSGVTMLEGTFEGCTNLVNAPEIPNTVTYLGSVFEGCTSLVNAPEIPDSVTTLFRTFEGCTSLVNAPTLPNSIYEMRYAFKGCTALKTAPEIPSTVKNIADAFNGCSNLTGTLKINAELDLSHGMAYTYTDCFKNAATEPGCNLVLVGNGMNNSTIDALVNTKTSNSNITKGS